MVKLNYLAQLTLCVLTSSFSFLVRTRPDNALTNRSRLDMSGFKLCDKNKSK